MLPYMTAAEFIATHQGTFKGDLGFAEVEEMAKVVEAGVMTPENAYGALLELPAEWLYPFIGAKGGNEQRLWGLLRSS